MHYVGKCKKVLMSKRILDTFATVLNNFNLLPAVRRQDIPSAVIGERHKEYSHILFILVVGWD
jgi:hypothetical protein